MNAQLQAYLEVHDVTEPCPPIRVPTGPIPAAFIGDCTRQLERAGANPDYVRQFGADVSRCRNDDAIRRTIGRYFQLSV